MTVHVSNSLRKSSKSDEISQVSCNNHLPAEQSVGRKIRELRNSADLSLKTLSEKSGLNINTLSLIENGKTSPSVSTLQQLARALVVPITAFFESEPVEKRIVYTHHDDRPGVNILKGFMENLGLDLRDHAIQPFILTLQPGAGDSDPLIIHTGHEFIYCLTGKVDYEIEGNQYPLNPGDSLVFEAHLPHKWQNKYETESQILLVLVPADSRDEPGGRHFVNLEGEK